MNATAVYHIALRSFLLVFPLLAASAAAVEAQRPVTRRPVQMSGQPGMVGPPKPSFQASVQSVQGTMATVSLTSADAPTAMRFANSREELLQASWQPFTASPTFAMNGHFPAQVWVQVGLPVGPGAHPVDGPHVESDPFPLRDPQLGAGRAHLDVDFVSGHGTFVHVPGTLRFRLHGVGEARQIRVQELHACRGAPGLEGPIRFLTMDPSTAAQPRPTVERGPDGSFTIRLENGHFDRTMRECTSSIRLLGDGGNFDPGVEYVWTERSQGFRIRNWERYSTTQTAQFPFKPAFGTDSGLATATCDVRVIGQRVVLEASSGPLPNACIFQSPEVLLPPYTLVHGLVWRIEELPADPDGGFHCQLGPGQDFRNPVLRFNGGRGRQSVEPLVTDYAFVTHEANPLLPDNIRPEVNADLSTAARRDWILPLQAVLTCAPFVHVNAGGASVDRIRLILDTIHYQGVRNIISR